MEPATVYSLERPDLGAVYVGETSGLGARLRSHLDKNTRKLFDGPLPRVRVWVVNPGDGSYGQLLKMREYAAQGWNVVSDLGWADAKRADSRVMRSPEWTARRQGRSNPFGGRQGCTWSHATRLEQSASFKPGGDWARIVAAAETDQIRQAAQWNRAEPSRQADGERRASEDSAAEGRRRDADWKHRRRAAVRAEVTDRRRQLSEWAMAREQRLAAARQGRPWNDATDARRGVISIGSSPLNDFVVNGQGVAPYHASLTRSVSFGEWTLRELGSGHSTALNGEILGRGRSVRARTGDVITLGHTQLLLGSLGPLQGPGNVVLPARNLTLAREAAQPSERASGTTRWHHVAARAREALLAARALLGSSRRSRARTRLLGTS